VEKESHAVTRVQLHQSQERVVALEEVLRNTGSSLAEGAGTQFEPLYEEVDSNAAGHSKGDVVGQFPHVVREADVQRSWDGGVSKDLEQSFGERDVEKEMLEAPTQKGCWRSCW